MIHHVFANRSNIGDWLSARGIQAVLGGPPAREYLCDEPFVDESLASLNKIPATDLVIIGGGGLFMDYFQPFWEGFRRIAGRVPYVIWGVGYCDIKHEPSRPPLDMMREIVSGSRLCVVRDELTRRLLADCALPPAVGCPSLHAIKPCEARGYGVLHVDNYTTVGAQAYERMDAWGREFAHRTQRPFRSTNNRIAAGNEQELSDTLQRYAMSDVILSSGLHGCILAVALGRKVLAVSGDHKIESFMEAAGLRDWVLDADEVERVPEMLSALADQPAAEHYVRQAREANRCVAQRILDEFLGRP